MHLFLHMLMPRELKHLLVHEFEARWNEDRQLEASSKEAINPLQHRMESVCQPSLTCLPFFLPVRMTNIRNNTSVHSTLNVLYVSI
jgi:hypothetical protein